MSDPVNHHYLPVFYLKRWAGLGGKVIRYHRPHANVVASAIAPAGTGFEPFLYILRGYPCHDQQRIEKQFMSPEVDNLAAFALPMLVNRQQSALTPEMRSAWTRFLMSLRLRNPEEVTEVKASARKELERQLLAQQAAYDEIKLPTDPPTFLDWVTKFMPQLLDSVGLELLPSLIDNTKIGQAIFEMHWGVVDFSTSAHSLLTSDRPFTITRGPFAASVGLADPRSVVAVPIGPRIAFVACRDQAVLDEFNSYNMSEVARRLNRIVVEQAVKHVYGTDKVHLRFVENRLTKS